MTGESTKLKKENTVAFPTSMNFVPLLSFTILPDSGYPWVLSHNVSGHSPPRFCKSLGESSNPWRSLKEMDVGGRHWFHSTEPKKLAQGCLSFPQDWWGKPLTKPLGKFTWEGSVSPTPLVIHCFESGRTYHSTLEVKCMYDGSGGCVYVCTPSFASNFPSSACSWGWLGKGHGGSAERRERPICHGTDFYTLVIFAHCLWRSVTC